MRVAYRVQTHGKRSIVAAASGVVLAGGEIGGHPEPVEDEETGVKENHAQQRLHLGRVAERGEAQVHHLLHMVAPNLVLRSTSGAI
eukprot:SAG11_NODE_8234_length_1043_cov_1.961864_1_plen_85_part_01